MPLIIYFRSIRTTLVNYLNLILCLGLRGVRLGITMPEIYEMQARAIFEAAECVREEGGDQVVPEIMIPLVSTEAEIRIMKKKYIVNLRRDLAGYCS